MAIVAGDVRLMKSQVMLDTSDGGGLITANEVVDGVSNNMFPDISELDRTYGRVALRKVFSAVNTPNTDQYFGAHAIITKPPLDPAVSVSLFSTEDWTDQRTAAKARMESYLASGPSLFGQLYGMQLAGQRSITMLFRLGRGFPDVSDTIVLVTNEGTVLEKSQYVRITKKTVVVQTIVVSYSGGVATYDANVVTYELSDALRYDFQGPDPLPYDNYPGIIAKARSTVVANAATYYGIAKLVVPVGIGDVSAKVGGIFTQLVPSGRTEVSITDMQGATTPSTPIQASVTNESYVLSDTLGPNNPLYLTGGVYPGSFSLAAGGTTLLDSGGRIMSGSTEVGSIDYQQGVVVFSATAPTYGGSKTAAWGTGAYARSAAQTYAIPVTSVNRAYVWNHTFDGNVPPGAVAVSFMAQGKWYDLSDQGNGQIKGSDSVMGSGSVNYSTGTVSVTLGALPDVGSAVLFYAGQNNVGYRPITTARNITPYMEVALAGKCIAPGTVTVTWTDGSLRTITDNGAGVLSGYGSGTVDYKAGVVKIAPTQYPASGTVLSYTITTATTPAYTGATPLASGTPRTLTTGITNIQPGTLTVDVALDAGEVLPEANGVGYAWPDARYYRVLSGWIDARICRLTLQDNGNAQLIDPYDGAVRATINYATGVITFTGTTLPVAVEGPAFLGATNFWTSYQVTTRSGTILTTVAATCSASGSLVTGTVTGTVTLSALKLPLAQVGLLGGLVPGSVRYSWGTNRYYDKAGLLLRAFNPATGAGTACGTLDATTGIVTTTHWVAGATVPSLTAIVAAQSSLLVQSSAFRVQSAPVLSGSFQMHVGFDAQSYDLYAPFLSSYGHTETTSPKGANYQRYTLPVSTVSITAAVDGSITTPTQAASPGAVLVYPAIIGTINYETGVVAVQAQMRVAGLSAPELALITANYPGFVVSTEFRIPINVDVMDLLYNAVTFAYMPLDADILGLDPVRLPTDGRVPIFSAGTVAVVHNTQESAFAGGAGSGAVLSLGRVRVASIRVYDSATTPLTVDPAHYTYDLDLGTVTLSGTYSAGAYTTPIRVEHRIEDMALVSDAQITGDLTFTRQITHAYPANTSYVSSAVIIGDQIARIASLFDQSSWTNVFADAPSGGSAGGTFNAATYPLTVLNRDAIEERWAIVFTDSNNFRVVGEHVGQIGTGNITTDCQPNNPNTGHPYFVINKLGWGGGWVAGNVLRFNTVAANFPLWVARTVQQSTATVTNDYFSLQVRGDVDA